MKGFNKRRITRIILVFCALGVMTLIFYLSSQPAQQSSELSRGISFVLIKWFLPKDLSETELRIILTNINAIIRKVAHFIIFSVLGSLLYSIFLTAKRPRKPMLCGMTIGLIYALSDEFHQVFVPGRGAQWQDVLLDFFGVIVGIVAIKLVLKAIGRNRGKNENYR